MIVFNPVALQQLVERIQDDLIRLKSDVISLEKRHGMLNNPDSYDKEIFQCILDSEASRLHGICIGIEKIIERLVRYETGSLPGGKSSHVELLLLAKEKAIISDDQYLFLRKLSSTRHFIRRAYGVELNLAELQEAAANALQMWPSLEATLCAHEQRLKKFLDLSGVT